MEKQIEQLANDIHVATRKASVILVEETRKFVKENHHYSSKNDFDKAHTKTLAELEAEYLFEQGYRKVVMCCECKYCEVVIDSIIDEPKYFCTRMVGSIPVDPTDYCSRAKMKGE